MSRTFNAAKCEQGSVNVGKYDDWAAERFPRGLTGRKRKDLTPEGKVVARGKVTRVSSDFVAVFLSVCEFGLVVNQNQDQTLPHKRAEALWDALHAKELINERFCARKWAVCREAMVRHGIIRITNRSYGPGHAMQWAVGPYFPFLGLWKARKKKDSAGSRLHAGKNTWLSQERLSASTVSGSFKETDRATQGHNTLLYKQPPKSMKLVSCRLPRPPPVSNA